jgi:hypothetical protein
MLRHSGRRRDRHVGDLPSGANWQALRVGLAEAEEAYVDSGGVLSPLHRDTEVLDVVANQLVEPGRGRNFDRGGDAGTASSFSGRHRRRPRHFPNGRQRYASLASRARVGWNRQGPVGGACCPICLLPQPRAHRREDRGKGTACGPQSDWAHPSSITPKRSRRIPVTTAETSSEPPQPSLLEKKMNMTVGWSERERGSRHRRGAPTNGIPPRRLTGARTRSRPDPRRRAHLNPTWPTRD